MRQCLSGDNPTQGTNACRAQSHNILTVCSRCLQLLGLRGREKYLEREVTAAYDTLAGTPLEEGYSPRVAAGRLAVLGQAVQHLRSTNGQAPLMGAGLEVEWDHLNGALALMQEVGGSCRWRLLCWQSRSGAQAAQWRRYCAATWGLHVQCPSVFVLQPAVCRRWGGKGQPQMMRGSEGLDGAVLGARSDINFDWWS